MLFRSTKDESVACIQDGDALTFTPTVYGPVPVQAILTDAAGNTLTTDAVTLTVTPPLVPPTISAFSSSQSSISPGQSTTLSWTVANATSVTLTPSCAISGNSCTVSPATTTTYTLTATGPGGNAMATATVTVIVPQITSVVNGGTFAPGITPNMWVTIFGNNLGDPNPQILSCPYPWPQQCGRAQVQIQFAGQKVNALLRYVSPTQINFWVPDIVPVGSNSLVVTSLTQNADGTMSSSLPVPVDIVTFAPAILAITGQAAAGNVITLWAMGLGPVQPGPYGLMWTTNTVVTINGIGCEIQFSGLAPGYIGLYQVNVFVPTSMSGGDQLVILIQDGIASPAIRVKVTP